MSHAASFSPSGFYRDGSGGPAPGAFASDPGAPLPVAKKRKGKRGLVLAIVLLLALAAIVGTVMFLIKRPKTFYLDDFFTVTVSGTDGYGTATLRWDRYALREINEYLSKTGAKKSAADDDEQKGNAFGRSASNGDVVLTDYVIVRLETDKGLKNGEQVKFVMDIPKNFEKTHNVRFKLRNEGVEISDLKEIVDYDPLRELSVRVSGYSGYGNYVLETPEGAVGTSFGSAYYYTDSAGSLQVTLEGKNGSRYALSYVISAPDALKNDDLITVTLSGEGSPSAEELASQFGVALPDAPTTFTVSGLGEVTECDPATFLTVSYEGRSGYGTASIAPVQETLQLGERTAKITTDAGVDHSCSLRIHFLAGSGYTEYTVVYTARSGNTLQNGDVITFSATAGFDPERLLVSYGLILPSEFTCTVSGLGNAVVADPFTAVNLSFSGYDGYASAEVNLTAASVAAGDYTLYPTFAGDVLTVEVKNASGESIFFVSYRLNKSSGLANGNVVAFDYAGCINVRDLREVMDLYALAFPAEKSYTVTSLEAPDGIDPRDQLIFRFEGEDGNIRMSLRLEQDRIVVGEYIILLEVAYRPNDYRGDYWEETFTVIDREGNEVASGRYDTDEIYGLSEGETIYLGAWLDSAEIYERTGLYFSAEPLPVVVTTR